jgi:hypothetical protein
VLRKYGVQIRSQIMSSGLDFRDYINDLISTKGRHLATSHILDESIQKRSGRCFYVDFDRRFVFAVHEVRHRRTSSNVCFVPPSLPRTKSILESRIFKLPLQYSKQMNIEVLRTATSKNMPCDDLQIPVSTPHQRFCENPVEMLFQMWSGEIPDCRLCWCIPDHPDIDMPTGERLVQVSGSCLMMLPNLWNLDSRWRLVKISMGVNKGEHRTIEDTYIKAVWDKLRLAILGHNLETFLLQYCSGQVLTASSKGIKHIAIIDMNMLTI